MTNIISITGDLGSGKSTVSDILCKALKFDYIYTGAIQRKIAERYNMTTIELNKYSESHPEIDEEIDSTFRSLNNASDLIVDSRMAWFFIPDSFKIYLKTNIRVSAERISKDKLRKNETYFSIEEAIHNIKERKMSENKRYKELYNADSSDLNSFNLVIDTSFVSPDKVSEIILSEYNNWVKNKNNVTRTYISPKNLYPTRSVKNEDLTAQCGNLKDTDTVTVVNFDFLDYIIDGHKRTACAIKNNIDLIPVTFISGESTTPEGVTFKEKIKNSIEESFIQEWEELNRFQYKN